MSAVEDRLAATLAKHRLQDGLDRYRCTCGATTAKGLGARDWRERHLAAVIASSADLAVIELPEPNKSGFVWVNGHGEVELLDYRRFLPDEAVQLAASLLAAVKAAEAVSDRG